MNLPDQAESTDALGETIGLIAGAGSLPIEAARLLRRLGHCVRAIAFADLTSPELANEAEEVRSLRLGHLTAMATAMEEMRLRDVLLIGKVPRSLLFDPRGIAEPDAEALKLLSAVRSRSDESLMAAIADWLRERKFNLRAQDDLLAAFLAPPGPLSKRSPTASERADFEAGEAAVAELGRAGVGQCVVVHQGSVLAVEAAEGTDAAIRRAGEFAQGATVVKASRPGQDRRFDLPAVGAGTIEAMAKARASALAIEAGSTLIVDSTELTRLADDAGIAVWGFSRATDRGRRPTGSGR